MDASFLDHIDDIEDPCVPGMVVYRLDEILLTVLVGLLCRAEDLDEFTGNTQLTIKAKGSDGTCEERQPNVGLGWA